MGRPRARAQALRTLLPMRMTHNKADAISLGWNWMAHHQLTQASSQVPGFPKCPLEM